MSIRKKVALFDRSMKNQNYCAGGIDIDTGKYIRPISDIPGLNEAVRIMDYKDEHGNEFNDFDIVEIVFKDKMPENPYQPENLIYDEHYRWRKIDSLNLKQVIERFNLDELENIFYNNERSVEPVRIEEQANRKSLLFMQIQNLFIKVERYNDYPKFYADFEYKGKKYHRFSVGDINIRKIFWNSDVRWYRYRNNATVILSLTNPYAYGSSEPKCYKMLAQVF